MCPAPRTKPWLASTVLLLRDGDRGLEVFMEKRHIKSDFVGGAYVFPGGRVDADDTLDETLLVGCTENSANLELGLEGGGLAHYVSAIRECFEEAGVLLAYDHTGNPLDLGDETTEARFKELRDQLNAGTLSLEALARQEKLRLATDRIQYWSHWITPEGQPRRYDTRFFVTRVPETQTAEHDDWELTSSAWVTPAEAIERALRREWMIIFPTLMNLSDLGRFDTADAAITWAAQDRDVPANLPRVLEDRVVLPGDDGYEEAETDVSKADPKIFWKAFPR